MVTNIIYLTCTWTFWAKKVEKNWLILICSFQYNYLNKFVGFKVIRWNLGHRDGSVKSKIHRLATWSTHSPVTTGGASPAGTGRSVLIFTCNIHPLWFIYTSLKHFSNLHNRLIEGIFVVHVLLDLTLFLVHFICMTRVAYTTLLSIHCNFYTRSLHYIFYTRSLTLDRNNVLFGCNISVDWSMVTIIDISFKGI